MEKWIIPGILLLILIVVIARNIRVVQQARAFVIERLGAYRTTWHTGLHMKVPFIERVAKIVTLKEQFARVGMPVIIKKEDQGLKSFEMKK